MKLKIRGLDFSYDSVKALESVSLEVNEGEILGVIGPNGSGKTTLLKCINLTLRPKAGVVLIGGEDVFNMGRRKIAREVAVVPQNSSISFPFTVLDIVLMGRIPHLSRLGREGERDLKTAEEAMRATDTLRFASRPIDGLSGGELQRVMIARALAQEPSILLLDEPTLHLDINHQLEILKLIRKLTGEKGLATIMVSHNLNLAARYSDKLLLLNSGRIYSVGSIEEVLTPENIKNTYKVEVDVRYHEATRSYNVIPIFPIDA
ncbi:MAG: Cobalamin import ATP-binding protein BtuD [Candidatus Bathyarchaeota archaeon BA2]|nr:MAG: Cobalamin import ATP-binding protein BtuD [Candidatus Bathyarchaeota archaeon BA2]